MKSEVKISKGIVSKVSNKDGRFGIQIADTWYNGFGTTSVKSGDEVEFEYSESEGRDGRVFKNVSPEDIKILQSSSTNSTGVFNSEVRYNVDAGNILQREIEALTGLTLAEKKATLAEGSLGKILVGEFVSIRSRLKELDNEPKETF